MIKKIQVNHVGFAGGLRALLAFIKHAFLCRMNRTCNKTWYFHNSYLSTHKTTSLKAVSANPAITNSCSKNYVTPTATKWTKRKASWKPFAPNSTQSRHPGSRSRMKWVPLEASCKRLMASWTSRGRRDKRWMIRLLRKSRRSKKRRLT